MRERNYSVDILKFLAAIFITNSHMITQYGKYDFLATGGAEGDFLFFFCSGFTLLLSPMGGGKNFINWYAKRIRRIYPSIFAIALISSVFFANNENFIDIIIARKYWFVSCIMCQYVIVFIIGSYFQKYIRIAILLTFLLATILFIFDNPGESIWKGHYISRYILSFDATLIGAYLGCHMNDLKFCFIKDLVMLVMSYVLFRLCGFFYHNGYVYFDLLRAVPLYSFVFYLFKIGSSTVARKIYESAIGNAIIMTVGSLCLEIYLVQRYILHDDWNHLFPLNIVLLFLIIIVCAYLVRCLARLFGQVFSEKQLNYSEIIKLY